MVRIIRFGGTMSYSLAGLPVSSGTHARESTASTPASS